MIEVSLAEVSKICVQQLEILAAIRGMCSKHELPFDRMLDWEIAVAGVLKSVRLAMVAKGDVWIIDD